MGASRILILLRNTSLTTSYERESFKGAQLKVAPALAAITLCRRKRPEPNKASAAINFILTIQTR